MNRRSYRRRRSDRRKIYLLIAGVLAVVLAGSIVYGQLRKTGKGREAFQTSPATEISVPVTETEIETEAPTTEVITAPTTTEAVTETTEVTTVTTEAPTQPETEPPLLPNLSGIAPGTVLDESRLDFENLDQYFMWWEIEPGDNLYERINGKSYQENDDIPVENLRYLKMVHYNFDGKIQVGELIVNEDIRKDIIHVFKELFLGEYQIYSMYLVDNYWVGNPTDSDSASIDENNTSAFCYRAASGGKKLSDHAYGRAIDINPQQNPYVSYSSGSPKWEHSNANDYIKRDTGLPHVITRDDLAYQVFTKYGFIWGGDWNNPKDYQHFAMKK